MKSIKKFIARLFGITPEDLEPDVQTSELKPEIIELIRDETRKYLDQELRARIIPEIEDPGQRSTKVDVPAAQESKMREDAGLLEEFPEIDESVSSLPEVLPDKGTIPPTIDHKDPESNLEEEILPLDRDLPENTREILQHREKDASTVVKEIRLGIDFGTTTTAVSARFGDEPATALRIGSDGLTGYMPSVVYFRPGSGNLDERVLVGEYAEASNDETRIIRSVKRCFACEGKKCLDQASQGTKHIPWCKGDGRIRISETETIPPEQVAVFIIREAIKRALQIIKDSWNLDVTSHLLSITPVNLGCGANFNFIQRSIILNMAKAQGFQKVTIQNVIEEPILAGFTFSRFAVKPEGRSLIYDFGGGTLDIAIVDVDRIDNRQRVTVLATAGDNWLGGDDIDSLIYEEFMMLIGTSFHIDRKNLEKRLEPIDQVKIRQMAKTSKERLSKTLLFKDALLLEQLGTVSLSLSRERFETILTESDIMTRSRDTMLRALKLVYALDIAKTSNLLDVSKISKLSFDEAVQSVDKVIPVGGVTKIPCIRNEIESLFGTNKVIDEEIIDPVTAIAIGAAYPREVEHFSIAYPPFGFDLEYTVNSDNKRGVPIHLVEPFQFLEFYRMAHVNSLPYFSVQVPIDDELRFVKIVGKKVGDIQASLEESLGNLHPGNHEFQIHLDGNLVWVNGQMKRRDLGQHPFVHPLQNEINEWRAKRYAEEYKKNKKTPQEDLWSLYNEN